INGADLNLVIDKNLTDEALYISKESYEKISNYNKNELFFEVVKKYDIKSILKSKITDIDDDTIIINKDLYEVFKFKGYKYIRLYNPLLNISSTYKYKQNEDTSKKNNTIWINYKNRSLLGMELKISYTLYEYEKIIKMLNTIDFAVEHCNKKYLIKFFERCFYLEESNNYQQYTNIVEKIKEVYDEDEMIQYKLDIESKQDLINKIKKDYSSIFKLYIVGTSIHGFSKKNMTTDLLIGYSKGKVFTSRINDYLEGTNNVKINEITASVLDVRLNERIIIYNENKKLSCRVIIDENVSDMELQISKSIRKKLNISYANSVVNVKRDNTHIIMKKLDSLIITISLTSITIISFFKELNLDSKYPQIILIVLIIILTITSTFSDRRKNVKK
ncbi:MAG: hypothetical protein IJO27_04545, partial [Bacilli bacterium]|nr:hypothetical protein [Bacilli bacterium]